MLAIAPDRVRLDLAEPGATEAVHDLMPRLVAEGVRAVSPNGVLGDPRGASTDEGCLLLERAVDELEQRLDAWPVGT
jgi:creatinine amidohydrolase